MNSSRPLSTKSLALQERFVVEVAGEVAHRAFEVGLDFLAVGNERSELSRIETAPLVIAEGALQGREQGHRALCTRYIAPASIEM